MSTKNWSAPRQKRKRYATEEEVKIASDLAASINAMPDSVNEEMHAELGKKVTCHMCKNKKILELTWIQCRNGAVYRVCFGLIPNLF